MGHVSRRPLVDDPAEKIIEHGGFAKHPEKLEPAKAILEKSEEWLKMMGYFQIQGQGSAVSRVFTKCVWFLERANGTEKCLLGAVMLLETALRSEGSKRARERKDSTGER
eukprot:747261-Rhodomonas_salina.1